MKPHFTVQILFLLLSIGASGQDSVRLPLEAASVNLAFPEGKENCRFLERLLDNNTILALGEASHGTSDFFSMKFQLIKYCVTELGYTSIGIEADYAGAQTLNAYVQGGLGNINEALFELGTAAWMTVEMKAIMEWLKEYNTGKSVNDKVQVWGFDMQFSLATVKALQKILRSCSADKASAIHFLDTLQAWKNPNHLHKQKLEAFIKELHTMSEAVHDSDRVAVLSLSKILQQSILFKSKTRYVERLNVRDSCMAVNVKTYHRAHNQKTILWAHNGHIAKRKNYKNWRPMGSYLQQAYGEGYYPMGFLTGKGKVGFYNRLTQKNDSLEIPPDSKKRSYDRILAQNRYNNFFIDLRSSLNNQTLKQLFAEKHLTRSIDLLYNEKSKRYYVRNHYMKESLYENFNGVIFIRQSSAARPIQLK